MAPATAPTAPNKVQDYLDMLSLALAAGARWWREQLTKRYNAGKHTEQLSEAQLDEFERQLCLGMMKLLLRNALERGLSWREWTVQTYEEAHGALREAAETTGIGVHCFSSFTCMAMRSTNDEVHIEVRFKNHGEQCGGFQHVWPL